MSETERRGSMNAMHARSSDIESLPRRAMADIGSQWDDISETARSNGGVAITNGDGIDMVLLSADEYRRLTQTLAGEREKATVDGLMTRFDAELASLRHPDTRRKVEALFAAKGVVPSTARAGHSF